MEMDVKIVKSTNPTKSKLPSIEIRSGDLTFNAYAKDLQRYDKYFNRVDFDSIQSGDVIVYLSKNDSGKKDPGKKDPGKPHSFAEEVVGVGEHNKKLIALQTKQISDAPEIKNRTSLIRRAKKDSDGSWSIGKGWDKSYDGELEIVVLRPKRAKVQESPLRNCESNLSGSGYFGQCRGGNLVTGNKFNIDVEIGVKKQKGFSVGEYQNNKLHGCGEQTFLDRSAKQEGLYLNGQLVKSMPNGDCKKTAKVR